MFVFVPFFKYQSFKNTVTPRYSVDFCDIKKSIIRSIVKSTVYWGLTYITSLKPQILYRNREPSVISNDVCAANIKSTCITLTNYL